MKLHRFEAPIRRCDYLPDKKSRMVYAEVDKLSKEEYLELINRRWRRFGYWLFRPECPSCQACQPIRVPVREYKPNRSQRRIIKTNSKLLKLVIGEPRTDEARINLYVDHHQHHSTTRGWRQTDIESALQGILS